MDWRRTISQYYADRSADDPTPDFRPGASPDEVAAVEQRLGVRFPTSLQSLLQETNGIMEQMKIGDRVEDIHCLLWPLDQIVSSYEDEPRDVLFFADAGADGIQFGFPIAANHECGNHVVVLHPIEDELTEVAPSLGDFLRRWLNGEISV